ncbi:hypothetical protein FPOAC2_14460 [Fusarium poae]
MALFSPQKEGLAATLSKPGDFFDWEHAFRIQAERLDLQQYLKRKTFLRDKPALPNIRKRKYTKTAQSQRTIRSETQESQESTQDDIQETANGTWVVSDLGSSKTKRRPLAPSKTGSYEQSSPASSGHAVNHMGQYTNGTTTSVHGAEDQKQMKQEILETDI